MPLLEASPDRIAAAARRVMARCDELARVSAQSGAIERVYLSPEHARVNRLAAEWMREVGLRTWQDAAGNQLGRIERSADPDPAAPALMIGSHLDTVKDAGRFDGIIGALMALEVVRLLRQESDGVSRVPLPFAVEVAAFSDEEGTRFGKALLGSSAVAGTWNDAWWTLADEDGVTLREAFRDFGLDPGRIGEAARRPDHLVAYLEAHIEQGPELDRAGEAALAVERICRSEHHIIGTVGQLEAFPGAVNVVPGEAHLSVDLRGELDGERDRVWDEISRELDDIMGRRGLRWQAREVHNAPAVRCGLLLQDVVREGIVHAAPRRSDEPPVIFSRAGHDAMAIGSITDVGMLFLRTPDGVSHHPDEAVSAADVALGIRALTESVLQLAADRL